MDPDPHGPLPRHVRVAVVGAGFSGLATLAHLRRRGETDVVVLEQGDEVGGTWRDNTYPGAACDVRSDLYSFSFAPNPGWRSLFAGQEEIQSYLVRTTDELGLRPHVRLRTELLEARWDDAAALWRLRTSAGDLTAEVLVSGAGPLIRPRWPDLPGLDDFAGDLLHTAHWDHDVDLRGRRVAVVGTGASAAQLVPHVAREAAHLTVVQRTPPWVLPRGDRATTPWRRTAFRRLPWLQRLSRARVFWRNEVTHLAFRHRWVGRVAERLLVAHLHRRVTDPDLRAALTPRYRLGCKRIIVSDDLYPALARDDVTLVTAPARAVTATGLRTADGREHPADVLVCSTGFVATDPPVSHLVHGRDGRTLAEHWAGTGMQALRGTTVAGFPNLVLLVGPNTALGHNSVVQVAEWQVRHALDLLDRAARDLPPGRRAVVEPTPAAQAAWNERLRRDLSTSVWVTGGCTSFYLDEHGRNTTLWPHRATRLRRALRHVDPAEYTRRVVDAVPREEPARAPVRLP